MSACLDRHDLDFGIDNGSRDTVPLGNPLNATLVARHEQRVLQMGMGYQCFVDDSGPRGFDCIRFYIS